MGKGVATEVPGMSQTAIWALDVQNCILLLRATPAQQQQNVVKIEFNLVAIQADALDEFAWPNALRQCAGFVPYCPIIMPAP